MESNLYAWDADRARKAEEKSQFIFVGGKNKKQSMRLFSGTYKKWTRENPQDKDLIFLSDYRIMGKREDVAKTLSSIGKTQSEIDSILKNAITFNNFNTTKKGEVEKELANIMKKRKVKEQEGVRLSDEDVKTMSKSRKFSLVPKEGTSERPKRARKETSRKKSLKEKYEALGEDEVLDVSNMDPETGAGVRKKKWPSKKGSKVHDSKKRLHLLTNDLDKYVRAIEVIFGSSSGYEDEIEEVRSLLQEKKTRKPRKSPRVSSPSSSESKTRKKSPLQTKEEKKTLSPKKESRVTSPKTRVSRTPVIRSKK